MKHLRKFNEDLDRGEVKDFCEINLAYLLDDGVEVVTQTYYEGDEQVKIYFHGDMSWDKCKDHVIPFLTRLVNKYELAEDNFIVVVADNSRNTNYNRFSYKLGCDEVKDIDQILIDSTHSDDSKDLVMYEILFYVKNEK